MSNRYDSVKYQMEIGSTISYDPGTYLIEDTPMDNETNINDEDSFMRLQDDDQLVYDIYEGTVYGDIDIDVIMVKVTHIRRFQGVDHTQLSRI